MALRRDGSRHSASRKDPVESARRRARARFRATGSAYIAFALAEPACSPLRCTPGPTPDKRRSPAPDARGPGDLGPYQLLVACVDELVTTGVLAPERRAFTDVAAWAAVHGSRSSCSTAR